MLYCDAFEGLNLLKWELVVDAHRETLSSLLCIVYQVLHTLPLHRERILLLPLVLQFDLTFLLTYPL